MLETARKQTACYQDKIIKELEAAPDMRRTMFSQFEDDMIKRFYPTKGSAPLAKALNKGRKQITNRASTLGLKRKAADNENSL